MEHEHHPGCGHWEDMSEIEQHLMAEQVGHICAEGCIHLDHHHEAEDSYQHPVLEIGQPATHDGSLLTLRQQEYAHHSHEAEASHHVHDHNELSQAARHVTLEEPEQSIVEQIMITEPISEHQATAKQHEAAAEAITKPVVAEMPAHQPAVGVETKPQPAKRQAITVAPQPRVVTVKPITPLVETTIVPEVIAIEPWVERAVAEGQPTIAAPELPVDLKEKLLTEFVGADREPAESVEPAYEAVSEEQVLIEDNIPIEINETVATDESLPRQNTDTLPVVVDELAHEQLIMPMEPAAEIPKLTLPVEVQSERNVGLTQVVERLVAEAPEIVPAILKHVTDLRAELTEARQFEPTKRQRTQIIELLVGIGFTPAEIEKSLAVCNEQFDQSAMQTLLTDIFELLTTADQNEFPPIFTVSLSSLMHKLGEAVLRLLGMYQHAATA